jgi:hypothetical protein
LEAHAKSRNSEIVYWGFDYLLKKFTNQLKIVSVNHRNMRSDRFEHKSPRRVRTEWLCGQSFIDQSRAMCLIRPEARRGAAFRLGHARGEFPHHRPEIDRAIRSL